MKKLLVLGACLLALSGIPVKAQAAPPEIVVVRVFDSGGKVHLVITGANGRSETFEFDSGSSNKSLAAAVAHEQIEAVLQGVAVKHGGANAAQGGHDGRLVGVCSGGGADRH